MTDDGVVEILLVEDNPYDEELTLHTLKQNNLANQIQVVRDGEEALDWIFRTGQYASRQSHNPKLILLDLKMPKVDGLQVLRRIKTDPATQGIPVVILTSSKEERDLVESYKLGVNSYVTKPIEFDEFSRAIKNLGYYWLLLNLPPPKD